MLTCIAHELRWCIEAHGLAVEESASERGGLIAFQPRGVVRQQGEAGTVGIVDDEIVRQKIVIAVNLQVVRRLRLLECFDLNHLVPIDIRAGNPRQLR